MQKPSSGGGAKESHWLAQPLELDRTLFKELNPRARHQILDGTRGQDFAGMGVGCYPRGNVDCNPAHVVAHHLDFAGVHTGAHLKIERLHRLDNLSRTVDSPRRAVEQSEETV